jgi:uncharacterized membrane protein HdeD (DUF308 family)
MTASGMETTAASIAATLRERRGWLLALGIVQIVLGVLAIGAPMVATLALAVFLGWLFIFSGVVHGFHAMQVRGWSGFLLHLLGAALYVVAGAILVTYPLGGALTLTLVLAAFFVVEGVSRTLLGLRVRPMQGWWTFLLGGIAGVVLGILIWSEWPGSALWAVGLLVGINLLFSGFSLTSLAMALRQPS